MTSNGLLSTVGVCGWYWMSSNISVRSTTAPGVAAMFSPRRYGVRSTMLGIRGGADMSLMKFAAPRRKFRPAVSTPALSACGLVSG
jgi:hypothetical protein